MTTPVAPAPPVPPPPTSRPPDQRVAADLRRIADRGLTGTLRTAGGAAEIVLWTGQVVLVTAPGRPTPEELLAGLAQPPTGDPSARRHDAFWTPTGAPAFAWMRICHESIADAALTALADGGARPEFEPGEPPERTRTIPPIPVPKLLAECTRRAALLRRMSQFLTPDTPLHARTDDAWPIRQLTPAQWRFLMAAEDSATAAEIAPKIGHGTTAATVLAFGLLRLELLTTAAGRTPSPAPVFIGS